MQLILYLLQCFSPRFGHAIIYKNDTHDSGERKEPKCDICPILNSNKLIKESDDSRTKITA